ncbi:hypothetical protein [Chitinophaga rhizophila]|uniref:Uncharacterized protein n=1 Tax=Chitinophaga rhizophila TaxID=2866212 RepID=A0ABS7GAL0_9BACT|nr:hypothetical protein [Chitinophaga rhizophila]MBW8684702.1 hypothetical protein [Chitinophaga rhizophila]
MDYTFNKLRRKSRIDEDLLQEYKKIRLEFARLWSAFDDTGRSPEFESNRQKLEKKMQDLWDALKSKYNQMLVQLPYAERKVAFFEDMQQAAANDHLELLEVLDLSISSNGLYISFTRDKFMLFYLTDFFSRVQDPERNYYAQTLFERILDTSDNDRNEYVTIMNDIFSLGKDTNWFDRFHHPFQKLLARAPDNAATLHAATRGLTGTAEGIRELCRDFVMARTPEKYAPASLYDPHDPHSPVTLTLPATIQPFIGMQLIGTRSTYRIKTYRSILLYRWKAGSLTYNCILTGNYFENDRHTEYLEYIPMTHNQHTLRRLLKQIPRKPRRLSRFSRSKIMEYYS